MYYVVGNFKDICTICKAVYCTETVLLNTIQLKITTLENIKLLIIAGIQRNIGKEISWTCSRIKSEKMVF